MAALRADTKDSLVAFCLTIVRVAEQLYGHRLAAKGEFAQCAHDLMHGSARRAILVEQITT